MQITYVKCTNLKCITQWIFIHYCIWILQAEQDLRMFLSLMEVSLSHFPINNPSMINILWTSKFCLILNFLGMKPQLYFLGIWLILSKIKSVRFIHIVLCINKLFFCFIVFHYVNIQLTLPCWWTFVLFPLFHCFSKVALGNSSMDS